MPFYTIQQSPAEDKNRRNIPAGLGLRNSDGDDCRADKDLGRRNASTWKDRIEVDHS